MSEARRPWLPEAGSALRVRRGTVLIGLAAVVIVMAIAAASAVLPMPRLLRFPLPAVVAVLLLTAGAPLLVRHLSIALPALLF